MGNELSEPLIQERDSADKDQLTMHWEGLSNYVVGMK